MVHPWTWLSYMVDSGSPTAGKCAVCVLSGSVVYGKIVIKKSLVKIPKYIFIIQKTMFITIYLLCNLMLF